ncbi:MAG: hypothetical protein MUO27_02640 [Sedimentisphaerales bacterium]|nr:hypothetical protein [Sedimentisphaerales bacterium]
MPVEVRLVYPHGFFVEAVPKRLVSRDGVSRTGGQPKSQVNVVIDFAVYVQPGANAIPINTTPPFAVALRVNPLVAVSQVAADFNTLQPL